MQFQTAFKAGDCAKCGATIARGDLFSWGANRGDRLCHACAVAGAEAAQPVRKAQPVRDWSSYQEGVFAFMATGSGSARIQAVAGSGKTTVIEEACRRLPPGLSVKYLVFNKKNATEAEERMPAHVDSATFHSSCNAHLSLRLGRPRIDDKKSAKILRAMFALGQITEREMDDLSSPVCRLVGLAKNHGIGAGLMADSPESWQYLIDHFDITFDVTPPPAAGGEDFEDAGGYADNVEQRAIELARAVLETGNRDTNTIDFDDMLYLTVKFGVGLPKYDVVMVDESQDTNSIQRAILRMMLKPGGRLIAVGDSRQAIYGFRGADADAMDRIAADFGCIDLPLSINYRCSLAVVEAAKQFCPELEAWSGAVAGSVEDLKTWAMKDFTQTDAVLCRVTAPLVTLAYRLLGNGIGCTVLGRDIGQGLVILIQKMQGKRKMPLSILQLADKLESYRDREVSRWMGKGEESKAQAVQDKVESVLAAIDFLPEDEQTIECLIERINNLFADDGTGRLTLSTVHKAKGLEWDRVFILDRQRMPSKWARQEWQQVQENNCIYIAMTRAKVDLRFIRFDDIVGEKKGGAIEETA